MWYEGGREFRVSTLKRIILILLNIYLWKIQTLGSKNALELQIQETSGDGIEAVVVDVEVSISGGLDRGWRIVIQELFPVL